MGRPIGKVHPRDLVSSEPAVLGCPARRCTPSQQPCRQTCRGGDRWPFRQPPAWSRRVDEVRWVGACIVNEVRNADPNQAVACAVGLALEQLATAGEDAVGELRRVRQLAVARADAEILRLQLEHDRPSRDILLLQPRRYSLGKRAQDRHEIAGCRQVRIEGRLGRHAFCVALGCTRRSSCPRERWWRRSPMEP